MKVRFIILNILFLSFLTTLLSAQESVVLNAAKEELGRNMKELGKEPNPPYFLSYNITETENITISATFGKIKINSDTKSRILDIDLRVGSHDFDNTHIIRGNPFSFGGGRGYAVLPIEDNKEAIRNAIWYATDKSFKSAVERFEKAKTNQAVKVREEDTSADFSMEQPHKYFGEDIEINLDRDAWAKRLENLSGLFQQYDWLYIGDVTLNVEILTKYFVSSEGSELKFSVSTSRIIVSAKTKAVDGMSLPLYKSYFSYDPSKLPDDRTIAKDVSLISQRLDLLREAPLAEPYTGPAILSGEAAGVFFHEIFGHRVEGHREKDPNSSQTFKDKIGEKILPDFIDVIFDPTIRELQGREVSGYFKYDDEGIEAQKVVTVEDGVFREFLMSRSPIENFPHSNGHGRKQAGNKAVSRQSNLLVIAKETVSTDELKRQLRLECEKQGKEYGLYFDVVQGGFTFTGRSIPNAFNVNPLLVFKIYADGRPDELVRGVDLIGTPLTTFRNIIKAGNDLGVFNGICGAESGNVPVSASSPSLLVSLIEVQRKSKSQAKPPILPAP